MTENTMRIPSRFAISVLGVAIALAAACAPSAKPVPTAPPDSYTENGVSAKVGRTAATAMIESALGAFNAGDYATWTRDWSDAMKSAIQEKDFLAARTQISGAMGAYVAVQDLKLVEGKTPGIVRWVATVKFEKGLGIFWIALAKDGTKIEGATFEPVAQ